jgi:hypothetical protein
VLTKKLLNQGFLLVQFKSSLRKLNGRQHDLVYRYGISVSQMNKDMFHCSSCSTSDTRRVNLIANPVINHEWEKDREVFTTSGTYTSSFVRQIFHSGKPSHVGDR